LVLRDVRIKVKRVLSSLFLAQIITKRKNDERLVPDLPRGRGRSIGGDLDLDEEGSE
jgi:hypothetical protein